MVPKRYQRDNRKDCKNSTGMIPKRYQKTRDRTAETPLVSAGRKKKQRQMTKNRKSMDLPQGLAV